MKMEGLIILYLQFLQTLPSALYQKKPFNDRVDIIRNINDIIDDLHMDGKVCQACTHIFSATSMNVCSQTCNNGEGEQASRTV